MADYFVAISEDGVRFKMHRDGTWQPDATSVIEDGIRFRCSDWGDSVAKVKLTENIEPAYEGSDSLSYVTQVGGFPVHSHFYFINGMLHLGGYSFLQEHADNNRFISDFEMVAGLLTTKYGNPVKVDDLWSNDFYKDDYSGRGMAIAMGHRSMFFSWEDELTTVGLQLTGDNHQIKLTLIYRSKRLKALADAAEERDKLVGL